MHQNATQEQPSDYENTEKVRSLMDACIQDAKQNPARLVRDKADLQGLQFYRGGEENHWTVWDPSTNMWMPRPYEGDTGIPEYVPRCCSNLFANKIDGITSILDQSEPSLEFGPATDDDEDLAAAEVANDALPALLEETDYPLNRSLAHQLIALTSAVAFVYYLDNDPKHGEEAIEAYQCQDPACGEITGPMEVEAAQGQCPTCGGEVGVALQPDASPVQMMFPVGKLCAEVVPSFEFSLPSSARIADTTKCAWFLMHTRMTWEEAIRLWPEAQQAKADGGAETSPTQRHFADQMAALSGPLSRGGVSTAGAKGPIVYRLQHDPIETEDYAFPDGLFAVSINGTIVESTPLPFRDDRDQPFKAALIRTYQHAPGTQFGKPPSDDLVPIQKQHNLVQSLILLILMHDAAPRTYVPLTVTLENEITGRPGEQIHYRSLNGEKPITEYGVNPPEGLFKFLDIIEQQADRISKLNAVLQGARPDGDPTLGEVELLAERGMSAFKGPIDALIRFEKAQARYLLAIARQTAWAPRFRKLRGESGEWEVKQFVGADLSGSVDVTCESTTAWPKSPMMNRLAIDKLLERGVLNPADPEIAVKVFEKYGVSDLRPSVDVDRKKIMREIDRWKAATSPHEIAMPSPWANAPLEFHYKRQFLNSEDGELLAQINPAVFAAITQHMLLLQMMAMPQPAPADGAAQQDRGPDGQAVDEAVESGAITPAGAQGDPVQGALAAGAVVPAEAAHAADMAALPSLDQAIAARALTPVSEELTGVR